MTENNTTALEYLKNRYIGNDSHKAAALEQEFLNAGIAAKVYELRKRHGLTQTQLAKLAGTKQSVISRLEDADYGGHTTRLLGRIAAALGEELDVTFKHVNSTTLPHADSDPQFEELIDRCPAEEMRKRDWLPSFGTVQELRNALRAFLGTVPPGAPAHFRISKPDEAREPALVCWLTKLEIEAQRISAPRFSTLKLKKDLPELVRLSASANGPAEAVGWLEDHGMRCVFIRHLPETYLDGASMFTDDGLPCIGMTLRHDRLDNFWFTLLHELGHILLHREELQDQAILDERIEENEAQEEHEVAADRFARNAWVKPDIWQDFRQRTRDFPKILDIQDFASELQVTPALIAGRLRHELRRYTHYKRFLGTGTVRDSLQSHHTIF